MSGEAKEVEGLFAWKAGEPTAQRTAVPCSVKQVAALVNELISNEGWVGWELLGKHWSRKRSDTVRPPPHPRQKIISVNAGPLLDLFLVSPAPSCVHKS